MRKLSTDLINGRKNNFDCWRCSGNIFYTCSKLHILVAVFDFRTKKDMDPTFILKERFQVLKLDTFRYDVLIPDIAPIRLAV